ncbi:MAG: 2-amino-4-hydroxy-6-hydroxymethyldihydropteridine diphosphokinase [Spirochaetota bacterium]
MERNSFSIESKVFLGLGSNLGEREKNIVSAAEYLTEHITINKTATLYETLPRYNTNQPRFLNTVISGKTDLEPFSLLKFIQKIENALGRNREKAGFKGPRSIDIDILLYGKRVIKSETLILPHPGIKERKFVLVPLLEIEPLITDPETGKQYSDYLSTLEEQGIYYFSLKKYSNTFKKFSRKCI